MSFRNGLGYAVFFLTVMLPTVDAWQAGSETERLSNRDSDRSSLLMRNLPTRRDGLPGVREQMNRSWWPDTSRFMWLFSKTILAMFGATVSLLILMPFRGCKRYAILFGPPTGLMVVTAVGLWLVGRQEIYRFEPVIVAVLAALPTAALWFYAVNGHTRAATVKIRSLKQSSYTSTARSLKSEYTMRRFSNGCQTYTVRSVWSIR
jgi:hypothetical protein